MAAATEATIIAGVKTLLDTVTGIGQTHDYERWCSDWTAYLDNFKTSAGIIIGWTITCDGIGNRRMLPGADSPLTGQMDVKSIHVKTYSIIIRGYYGLDDAAASEKTARALAEDVVQKFEAYPNLNGVLENGYYTEDGWPSLVAFEMRSYGGVMCHYSEIRFEVWDAGPVTYLGVL